MKVKIWVFTLFLGTDALRVYVDHVAVLLLLGTTCSYLMKGEKRTRN